MSISYRPKAGTVNLKTETRYIYCVYSGTPRLIRRSHPVAWVLIITHLLVGWLVGWLSVSSIVYLVRGKLLSFFVAADARVVVFSVVCGDGIVYSMVTRLQFDKIYTLRNTMCQKVVSLQIFSFKYQNLWNYWKKLVSGTKLDKRSLAGLIISGCHY